MQAQRECPKQIWQRGFLFPSAETNVSYQEQDKKIGLSKEPLLTKLRILEFPCPGMTHNTILAIIPPKSSN